MESKIIIRNIDVYDDVTMAQVLLQAEGQEKKLKCLWRTARIRSKSTGNRIPRGTFPLQFKPRAGYLPALVLKVSVQCFIGIVPYKHVTWENFGNGIYLLNPDESIVSEREYSVLVNRLVTFGVKEIEIEDASKDTLHDGENFLFDSKDKWEGWK
jgi:hypothetical protein